MRKLTERRRNPDINTGNRRKDGAETILSYLGDDRAFLHMGHTQKMGINPMFDHQTPLGIYAYPLAAQDLVDDVRAKGIEALPFRSNARFAHILLADIPDQRMLSVYTNAARMEETLRQLANRMDLGFMWPTIMNQAEARMKKSDSGERIIRAYQASRSLAYYMAVKRNPHWHKRMGDMLDDEAIYDGEFDEMGGPNAWNAVLRSAGFDAMTDEGIGYIHFNEQAQTCFFSKTPIQRVITVEITTGDYPHNAKEIGSVGHLMRLIRNGLDPIEAAYIMDAMVRRRGTPPSFTEWSYKAGVCPTRGEVNAACKLLMQMHPESNVRYWETNTSRLVEPLAKLHEYVMWGIPSYD